MIRQLLFLLLLTLFSATASEVYMDEREVYLLGSSIDYLEDATGTLTIEDVRNKAFADLHQEVPNFGFSSSVYWLKVTIFPERANLGKQWRLSIEYPLLDEIELFAIADSGEQILHQYGGKALAFAKKELAHRNFLFSLPLSVEPLTLYIRVRSKGALQIPLQLQTDDNILEAEQTTMLKVGIYYGIFLIIFVYNIIMYFYTREENYLLYLFFLISFIGWQLTVDGLGRQYIWTNWQWMIDHGGTFWMSISLFTVLYFTRSFLQTKQHVPRLDKLLYFLMLLTFLLVPASFIVPYGILVQVDAITAIALSILLLTTGIIVFKQNYRPARFYIAGWSAFLLGSIVFALNKFSLFHGFHIFNHAQQIGSMLEMVFLSWALADKVKLLQDEFVEKLSGLNLLLQGKVHEGLEEARERDRMLLKQSRMAALGEMIEQIAHQWRQPLNTMALIMQDLYVKVKLGKFSEEIFDQANERMNENLQHMSKTIDDFRKLNLADDKAEHFTLEEMLDSVIALNEAALKFSNITCSVHGGGVHYITAVKNEVIQVMMNLMKNARDAIIDNGVKNGQISIAISEDRKNFILTIEDNGGGIRDEIMEKIFNPYFTTKTESEGTGIGLYMSRSILEDSIKGSLDAENAESGARFTIRFPKL